MALLKCKMCGGDLNVEEGMTVCECEYCNTKQTVPSLDDDKKLTYFTRANRLRSLCEFDKAYGVYESIVVDYPEEAEAYWGLILCKYGIEYVDDPATAKKIPTCHRSSFDSVMEDSNYEMVLEYSDTFSRAVYRDEAKRIEELRKGIIEISGKEEPYVIFICYKETDANGERTIDSVIAQDVYKELTSNGYRVFFSRITLEDKLGQEYEPYIFAALHSSKVMLVFGTDYEYFNAVWVKNEWSRYLQLIAQGEKKALIPCYKGIDAYDMPKEFARLQAQDMGKVGAVQDLMRGIDKLFDRDNLGKVQVQPQIVMGATNVDALLKRAFLYLEDGNWTDADAYCEKVLDQDPENAQAYLGKLLAELRVRKQDDLGNCKTPFDNNENYKKAVRFGDDDIVSMLNGYNNQIIDRNKSDSYEAAVRIMNDADTEEVYKYAANEFNQLRGFKDSADLVDKCFEKAEECRKNEIYNAACGRMNGGQCDRYESAIEMFRSIPDWKDSDRQIAECQRRIREIKDNEEAERIRIEQRNEERRAAYKRTEKTIKKTVMVILSVALVVAVFVITLISVIIPAVKHSKAMKLIDSGKYAAGIALLEELGKTDEIIEIRSSSEWIEECPVGDTIVMGVYEDEPIEWLVLNRQRDTILVISNSAIDSGSFNGSRLGGSRTNSGVTSWENSSLREWLNDDFYREAFSSQERSAIQSVEINDEAGTRNDVNSCDFTEDCVFLLSVSEVERYLNSSESRRCGATAYAEENGVSLDSFTDGEYYCSWWLRSVCGDDNTPAYVDFTGHIHDGGAGYSNSDNYGVRPAMWISVG